MAIPDPDRFAQQWLSAFNNHDIDAVLAHFAGDVVFTSPVAAWVVADSQGVIRGKAELRAYWTMALARVPDLRFELLDVYAGIDTVVINYRNQAGGLVCEVLTFRDGLVVVGHGTYRTAGD